MEISNLMPNTTVMVGVRVLMGCRSLERAPSFIEVFGRTQNVSTNYCYIDRLCLLNSGKL